MTYTNEFYSAHRNGARQSATQIVPMMMRWIAPRSVIDVGCGVGAWLATFSEHGVKDIAGVDGHWVDCNQLEIPTEVFTAFDLRDVYRSGRSFDLAMSLEVAEHLPPQCASSLVQTLCGLAEVVLFSAAIPFQGGNGHVNEQWPDYWANLFEGNGYRVIDAIRRRVWSNPCVDWFYAQNILLFATDAFLATHEELNRQRQLSQGWPLALVHPTAYSIAQELHYRLQLVAQDIASVVDKGEAFILVDGDDFRSLLTAGARAIPFLEKDGAYWGPPVDDATAIAELQRLRQEKKAQQIIFLWSAFWWLDYYKEFASHLHANYPLSMRNDRVMAFKFP